MPSTRNLFVRFTGGLRLPESFPGDHHTPTETRPAPDVTPWVAPAPRARSRRPRRLPDRVPYRKPNSDVQALRRLARLTEQLGSPLAAAQHEFAPHLRKDTQ